MKNKLKLIFYYILELLLSVFVVAFCTLIITKTTIYDSKFIKQQFNKNNYYQKLSTTIQSEMSKYIIQSGFPEDIIENIYTEDMLKNTIENMIDSIYDPQIKITTDITQVKTNLENNIDQYLANNNLKIDDQDALDRFVKQMTDIYSRELTISNVFSYIDTIVNKTMKILGLGIVTLAVIIILLIVFIKAFFKQNTCSIPLLVNGIILLIIYYYIYNNLNITSIYLWDSNISALLQSILNDIINKIKIISIISLIIGTLDIFIATLFKKKKKSS